jgi:hypothetical protein
MILGLMAVFNEFDILQECLEHHVRQGVRFLVLDNGSTDGSWEVARAAVGGAVLATRRVESETYNWASLLQTLVTWSEEYASSWTALVDADTFLETPWPGVTLADGLMRVAAEGSNTVRFDNFEFWPVASTPEQGSVRERLRYYSWSDDRQEKCWRSTPGVRNHRSGGHVVDFPSGSAKRVWPQKFVMRHYPIRSVEHGIRKVFRDRLPRFRGEPAGWHVQYEGFTRSTSSFLRSPEQLTLRVEGEAWNTEPRLRCRSSRGG